MPSASDGWGDSAGSVPSEGWGAAAEAPASSDWGEAADGPAARPQRQPRRPDDDEADAKVVDDICPKVISGKKRQAGLRASMVALDTKLAVIQADIDVVMPELQETRTRKSMAMGMLADTRLPPHLVTLDKELRLKRKQLPGGFT